MKEEDRKDLVTAAAAKVHEAWCIGELRAFYDRFLAETEKDSEYPAAALDRACFKNGKKRNEVELDTDWLMAHLSTLTVSLKTFGGFMTLFDNKVVVVKRFTKRNLTEEEQKRMGKGNYHPETQEENILRPFKQLSADSQKENLEAAKGAAYVYEEYAKRGATLDQFASPETKEAVGTLIHADWMRRNEKTDANKHLFVAYDKLDDWTKQQDLDVFEALIKVVKKDEEKYAVEVEEGLTQINLHALEVAVLDAKNHEMKI